MSEADINSMLNDIESRVGSENVSKSCSRDGCKASLEDVPSNRLIVDSDKACRAHDIQGERCDYVMFVCVVSKSILAAPIELKSGNVDVSKAHGQLQSGVDFVQRFVPSHIRLTCDPILVHGKGIHPSQRKKLNRVKVNFRGRRLTIKTTRCNRPKNLARVLRT